jgi:hypothetical protein
LRTAIALSAVGVEGRDEVRSADSRAAASTAHHEHSEI